MQSHSGLGELLRYITDLVDTGSEKVYSEMAIHYRPRYTPVLRAIVAGADTVTAITARTFVTQGAISQSVAMMEKEGILTKQIQADGRKSTLILTQKGQHLSALLAAHWQTLFLAISQLEQEIGHPLIAVLEKSARALETVSFDERIRRAGADKDDRQ